MLAAELAALGAKRVRPLSAGVAFFGLLEVGYRACLWSRAASRILFIIARVPAADANELYDSVRALPWEEHVDPGRTISVTARGANASLADTRFVALKVKDALCDRLRELGGARPSVAKERADVRIDVSVREMRATVSLDLAGEPLHMRKYRVPSQSIVAPLRETLGALLCLAAGWKGAGAGAGADASARPIHETVLLDPLCGSGTIAIEAALIALDRAPGLLRDYWGFTGWLGHDDKLWSELLDEAKMRAEQALHNFKQGTGEPLVYASDNDPAAVAVARKSAEIAGVDQAIDFSVADIAELAQNIPFLAAEASTTQKQLLVVTNPPYGQRLASASQLPSLYAALRSFVDPLLTQQPGELCIITTDESAQAYLGQEPLWQIETYNGPTEAAISFYSPRRLLEEQSADTSAVDPLDKEQFENRLKKMAQHRSKWARKNKVSCYRVYDADLPSFAVAIDVYEGAGPNEGARWLHIAEYAPPKHIDPALAKQRLAVVLSSAPRILDVPLTRVHLKTRKQAKGGSQYAASSQDAPASTSNIVAEGGLLFEIDLATHLDTGIFLDHRITRAMLREHAAGRDTLNLFAYTGTASVYMAAGKAKTVTTIDLSKTYLSIAERNMERNGFKGDNYPFVKADALQWVDTHHRGKQKYGLIFCDPPTFSNSTSMGKRTWDVQRDHAELLIALSHMLTPDGEIIFSTNLRSFTLDKDSLQNAGISTKDITTQTIPPDFERSKKIHHCYLLTSYRDSHE
ncbi:MAG: bifunctional 23S rRNA (guanine(2069)-N(7))-methyltransferase RlmK/23S rRNA (guanine(2445)-N(2))-methyltransferase RlmL [Coriobacteriia bacterium]|nr:bifunctional 23S rRNA (guanine(2069)-N(7))-methyltransferase RlmK/23S rRNA (guanine(2445)-N(2))-methyltransferase RlmL [Coriobacteriia bacterium]